VTLRVPEVPVIEQVSTIWHDVKKPANVVLVFDKSGSMRGEKIAQALNGAVAFVREMDRKDWLVWLPFDDHLYPGTPGLKSDVGEQLESEIRSTTARGETALYDAIARAYKLLEERRESDHNTGRYGIVVLSDGRDTNSQISLTVLEEMLRPKERHRRHPDPHNRCRRGGRRRGSHQDCQHYPW
jgi:Mg-chelatase subunit ChlD